jgi:F-type H+-transporting ATPase subunit b
MSQLFDAFGLQLPLLIAQVVNFGILMVGLRYFLYKPVMKTLEERREKIAQGVHAAEVATEKAAKADEEAHAVLKGAESEAEALVATARDTAQSERARIIKEAEARAASVEKDADERAKEDAARILRESEKEIARLSVLAAEKVLRTK